MAVTLIQHVAMVGNEFLWFAFGVFSVVATLFAIRLFRFFTISDHSTTFDRSHPARREPNMLAATSAPMHAPDDVPYNIDERQMPQGEDIDQLLPARVGIFRRESIRTPSNVRNVPVYANYSSGTVKVFVELGICDNSASALMGLDTAKAETESEFPDARLMISVGTEPSFLKVTTTNGTLMAWTRGEYYFSIHAKGGERDVDAFMESFPF